MKELGQRFLGEYVPTHCRATTEREYRRSVERFINPEIGTRKVIDIERTDIAKLHHGLRNKPYQANRTLGVLSKMFNLAEIWGLRPDGSNPCRHVKKYKEEKRERFLSEEEYKRLGEALREAEAEKTETQSAINAIWLLMLAGCRLSEIMTLKWAYVDLEAKELRLPDSKTSAKNRSSRHRRDRSTQEDQQARGQRVRYNGEKVRRTSYGPSTPLEAHPENRRAGRCAAPRPAALIRQPWSYHRRRVANDREAIGTLANPDNCPLCPSGE